MYNGVGLLTPRGSGTSGHVQSNAFNLRQAGGPPAPLSSLVDNRGPIVRKPNDDILEHNRKREIEVKLLELEEDLEDKGYSKDEIAKEVAEMRAQMQASAPKLPEPTTTAQETHAQAQRKVEQMNKIGAALGVRNAVEGEAFDQELQARRKEEKARAREDAERARIASEEEEEERQRRAKKEAKREARRKEEEEREAARAAKKAAQLAQEETARKAAEEARKEAELLAARRAALRAEGIYEQGDRSPERFQGVGSDDDFDDRLQPSSKRPRYNGHIARTDSGARSAPESSQHQLSDSKMHSPSRRTHAADRGKKAEAPRSISPRRRSRHSAARHGAEADVDIRRRTAHDMPYIERHESVDRPGRDRQQSHPRHRAYEPSDRKRTRDSDDRHGLRTDGGAPDERSRYRDRRDRDERGNSRYSNSRGARHDRSLEDRSNSRRRGQDSHEGARKADRTDDVLASRDRGRSRRSMESSSSSSSDSTASSSSSSGHESDSSSDASD